MTLYKKVASARLAPAAFLAAKTAQNAARDPTGTRWVTEPLSLLLSLALCLALLPMAALAE